jgi:hypothetical protein
MNKKSWILIIVAIALGIAYVIFFTDWFKPKHILITYSKRTGHVQFNFSKAYQLSYLKVVPVPALESNKYASPVWELKSDSNSAPIKFFSYGQRIRGMKPAVANTTPLPLDSGTVYRLFVEAGSLKAQHDFTP